MLPDPTNFTAGGEMTDFDMEEDESVHHMYKAPVSRSLPLIHLRIHRTNE